MAPAQDTINDEAYRLNGFTIHGARLHAIKAVDGSNGQFKNLIIRDNKNTDSIEPFAAGMLIDVNSNPTVDLCLFEKNHILANFASGGAMNIRGNSDPIVTNTVFARNSARPVTSSVFGGGAVTVDGGVPVFRHCSFVENEVENGDGGAVQGSGGGHEMLFVDCVFRDNRIEITDFGFWKGGGLNQPGLALINCTFVGNEIRTGSEEPAGVGGGLWIVKEAHLTNCLFAQNAAANGGGVYGSGAKTTAIHCTVAENESLFSGAGMYFVNDGQFTSELTMRNSILWGNVGSSSASVQDQQLVVPLTNLDVTYSCIQDDDPDDSTIFGGTGNIDDDPIYVAPLRRDYRIAACSPCIDAANSNATPADAEDVDEDMNATEKTPDVALLRRDRDEPGVSDTGVGDPVVDMGSYEYHLLGNLHHPNNEEILDGLDIQPFTDCWLIHGPTVDTTPEGNCVLADMDLDGDLDENDVTCFVSALLGEPLCNFDCESGVTSPDCNENGVWDATDIRLCDTEVDPGLCDCNGNGIPDECDIADCESEPACGDVNANGIPDGCEPDCNANGIPDDADIADETSEDCNANGIPDECEIEFGDCDGNDVLDQCEAFDDCDEDLIPDACEDDCDGNDIPDDCEIEENDCNQNGYLDACDLEIPPPFGSFDCNENSIPDECDIAACDNDPDCDDCNENGVPDACDIAAELSEDGNENGIPDECEQQSMMGGSEGGGSSQSQSSSGAGSSEEEFDSDAAWGEFFEWYFEQDFSEMTGGQRFGAIATKMTELGLSVGMR